MTRADATSLGAFVLSGLINHEDPQIHVIHAEVPDSAMNKIPGLFTATLVADSDSEAVLSRFLSHLPILERMAGVGNFHHFGDRPITYTHCDGVVAPDQVPTKSAQEATFVGYQYIKVLVDHLAHLLSTSYPGFTSTTSTFEMNEEKLVIGIDTRSTSRKAIQEFEAWLRMTMSSLYNNSILSTRIETTLAQSIVLDNLDEFINALPREGFVYGPGGEQCTTIHIGNALPGSTPPTELRSEVCRELETIASSSGALSYRGNSLPGQDTMMMAQRVARSGFAFIRAGQDNKGACHVKEESMTSEDMQAGARFLAAWLHQKTTTETSCSLSTVSQ
jgi:hypothetical protein